MSTVWSMYFALHAEKGSSCLLSLLETESGGSVVEQWAEVAGSIPTQTQFSRTF